MSITPDEAKFAVFVIVFGMLALFAGLVVIIVKTDDDEW